MGNPQWIEDGEKYALIGVSLRANPELGRLNLPNDLVALPNADFELPDVWREWLGAVRVKNVRKCSLFLISRMRTTTPELLDGENQLLLQLVGDLFAGLTLASKFTAFSKPFVVTGSRTGGEIGVRSFRELDAPVGSIVADDSPIEEQQLHQAARIAACLRRFQPRQTDHWRFFRCYHIYRAARTNPDMLDRIHQFTRCIEGFIASEKGKTGRQFKSRTELFIGADHHNLMGNLYGTRIDIEHLHENKHLEPRSRENRILLAEFEAVSEWIARSCLTNILLNPTLMEHFGSSCNLEKFWDLPAEERRNLWGKAVDPRAPLRSFNFERVSDEDLGMQRP